MQDSFENQTISEIPSILAKFLKISENKVTFPKLKKDSGSNLLVNAGKYTFLVDCKSSSAKVSLLWTFMEFEENRRASGKNVIPLLIVPFMGETGRHFCDEHKLAWLDLSGNAHIKAPGLLIHVEGQPNRFKSAGRPPNLFAPKSSRITRQLLIEPDRGFTQHELSIVTGLDKGHTSRIIRRLEEDRLIIRDNEGSLKPYDPNQLLDAWHEAYDFSRHNIIKGHIAARSGDELLHRVVSILDQCEINYAATGLAAAWVYTHFANFRIATFYLYHPPNEKIFGALNFQEDERGANTW